MSERKIVRIATSHYHAGHFVPAFVAKEITYFEEEGLTNYELLRGGLIPAMVESVALRRAMKEKGVDIVPDAKPNAIFQLASRGEDLFIVAGWRNQADWQFFGAKGIKGLADLKGKRIGTRDIGGISHRVLSVHLRRAGLDPNKDVTFLRGVRFHPHHKPDEALRKGEVDCITASAYDNGGLDKEGYPILLESRKVYPGGSPDRVIMATRRMVEEDSDLLEAYLRATIRSYWFMVDSRNRPYLDALTKRLRSSSADEEEGERVGEGGSPLALPFDGAPSVPGLEEKVRECKEMGDINEAFDLKSVLRLEFVQRAFKELEGRKELKEQISTVREIFEKRDQARAA